jgi:large subunit ribosomal protein L2
MSLKQYKPITSSQRGLVLVDRTELHKGKPFKKLTKGLTKSGGRNNFGHLTSRRKGGGHKRKYRIIDFKRNILDASAKVERIEYDPNRTAHIALIKYDNDKFSYIICPQNLKVGDNIVSSDKAEIKIGNCLKLKNMPTDTIIHNIELKPGKGAQLSRSAGTYGQLIGKDADYAQIKLSSGEIRIVRVECRATVGMVSNPDQKNIKLGKAGRKRWLGIRPVVRGVAMNPVDHPHGGGEGRTSGGRNPVSRKGISAKGKKTRNNKRTDKLILKDRRRK